MSKKPAIKWREADEQLLQRKVNNFNRKIDRIIKTITDAAIQLPSKISLKQARTGIKTRQQFNNLINSLARFTVRGAEKPVENKQGLKVTKWQKQEIAIKTGVINRRKTMQLKQIDKPTERGIMGKLADHEIKPRPFDFEKIKPRDWEKFVEAAEKQSSPLYENERAIEYKKIYLQNIKNLLGEDGTELYDKVEALDPETVYQAQFYDATLEIQFISDPLPTDEIADSAISAWDDYLIDLEED
jgi:hypothetical protein